MSGHISDEVRRRVREHAGSRCGYCLSPQHLVLGMLEIEHLVPRARGGSDDEENLWLACRLCNNFKADRVSARDPETDCDVAFFDPRRQRWADHFLWDDNGTKIQGKTPCGRATVVALQLNNVVAVTVRRCWVQARWHPPRD
ncbi:MAG: HNH endonuclease [Patescibacteria group bacterium]|nr:HNH endonuclease [Patescibacteria group bacterium]